ncbi:hypothetical protein A6A25_32415 [Saccharothrix sp. CB00851]|nr:hypothetical protein A6A25_32415 [Saccharothrix sp. CB00851]
MWTLGGVAVLDTAETSAIAVLFPAIRQTFGLSLSALGLLGAIVKLAGVVFGPFWVWVARRTSRKGVLVVACGLWSGWGVAAGFAQSFTQLLVLYAVLAVGCAAADPIVNDVVGDLFGDRARGRAAGGLYALLVLGSTALLPTIGQLTRLPDGWRIGLWVLSGLGVLSGLALLLFFEEPPVGGKRPVTRAGDGTWQAVRTVLKVPTFRLMLGSRLLSGHLLVLSFGVVYLVDEHHFDNATAALVILPFGLGYVVGALTGGVVGDRRHARDPRSGRIKVLQLAQVSFAVVAFFGTQFDWGGIGVFAVFFAGMGFLQGVNPGVNRPIVMAVVPARARGVAFAMYLSVFEGLVWATYQVGGGYLGDVFGLEAVFLVGVVGLMLVNAAYLTLLYRCYPRDAARARDDAG